MCIAHVQESSEPMGEDVANTQIRRASPSSAVDRRTIAVENPRVIILVRKSVFVFVENVLNISCGRIEKCEHHLLHMQTHAAAVS